MWKKLKDWWEWGGFEHSELIIFLAICVISVSGGLLIEYKSAESADILARKKADYLRVEKCVSALAEHTEEMSWEFIYSVSSECENGE